MANQMQLEERDKFSTYHQEGFGNLHHSSQIQELQQNQTMLPLHFLTMPKCKVNKPTEKI